MTYSVHKDRFGDLFGIVGTSILAILICDV